MITVLVIAIIWALMWAYIYFLDHIHDQSYDYLWKSLIAEAGDNGYYAMFGIACVYRNKIKNNQFFVSKKVLRDDLEAMVHHLGEEIQREAKEIVDTVLIPDEISPSFIGDVTCGANAFLPIGVKEPKWARRARRVIAMNGFQFYEVK